jgi:integrase
MSKRRGNSEGTITKRADGRWEARLSLPDGKRKSFYGKTQQEVQRKLKRAQRDIEEGLPLVNEKQTVEGYLTSWLDIMKYRIDASSLDRYRTYYRAIIAQIGNLPLTKVTAQHLQHLYSALLEKGWSAGTVNALHGMLHDALKQGTRLGVVQRNVVDLVDPPRRQEHDMQVLTPEQVRVFLASVAGDRFEALYVLVLSTGLRAGEVFALGWQDINLVEKTLSVRRAWQRTNTEYLLTLPKTVRARRTIALSQRAIEALVCHRERQQKERELLGDAWDSTYDLVFPNAWGKVVTFENFSHRTLHPALKRAGLPLIRFHDLRHTAATLLLSKGVNIKVVSEMLGHANVSITLRIYAHVLPHMQQAAAQAMDDILGEQSS